MSTMIVVLLLLLLSIPSSLGAINCTSDGVMQVSGYNVIGGDTDNVYMPDMWIGNQITFGIWVKLGTTVEGIMSVWECNNISDYHISVSIEVINSTHSEISYDTGHIVTTTSAFSDLSNPLWHHIGIVHNDTTVSIYHNFIEIERSTRHTTLLAGSRSSCMISLSESKIKNGFQGSLRDLSYWSIALTQSELLTASLFDGRDPTLSALCSSGCSGPFQSSSVPELNIAYASINNQLSLHGYVTFLKPLSHAEETRTIVLYSSSVGCGSEDTIRLYYTTASDGDDFGSRVVLGVQVGSKSFKSIRQPLRLGNAYHIYLQVNQDDPLNNRIHSVEVSIDHSIAIQEKIEENDFVLRSSSVSFLSDCSDVIKRSSQIILDLWYVNCQQSSFEQPVYNHKDHHRVIQKQPLLQQAVDTIVLPTDSDASQYVSWRLEHNGWTEGLSNWATGNATELRTIITRDVGNITSMAAVQNTQIVLLCSLNGIFRSDTGGLTWNKVLNDMCHSLVITESGLVLFSSYISPATFIVFRSEDGGETFTSSTLAMDGIIKSSAIGNPQLKLFISPFGEVFATSTTASGSGGGDQPVIWYSKNAGMSWSVDWSAMRYLSYVRYEQPCQPYAAFSTSALLKQVRLIACGGVIITKSTSGGWRFAQQTHGMLSISAVHHIYDNVFWVFDSHRLVQIRVLPGGVATRTVATFASELLNLIRLQDNDLAIITTTQLAISSDFGKQWKHVGTHSVAITQTGVGQYLPICTANSGCSGRGECFKGFIWEDQYPASCSCMPPFAPPSCSSTISCHSLENLINRNLDCEATSPEAQLKREQLTDRDDVPIICTWHKAEVRPGIFRYRCASEKNDRYLHEQRD